MAKEKEYRKVIWGIKRNNPDIEGWEYITDVEKDLINETIKEVKKLIIPDVGSFNLKIEDCWTAYTRIKADKGHLLNKSTEWNNAYQEGFEACFEWLQTLNNMNKDSRHH